MQQIYKIIFINDNKLFEIYAKEIMQSNLFGFIEIEEIVFGEQSSVVVDPSEEKLKAEFGNVIRSYIPMHNIIRIDEVPKQGTAKITDSNTKGSNVTAFPSSFASRTDFTPKD